MSQSISDIAEKEPVITAENKLFPVFLKLENLRLLIVGGGYIGAEKLRAVLNNSPATYIRMVSVEFSEEVRQLAREYDNILLIQKPYKKEDLFSMDIVIGATNDRQVNEQIWEDSRKLGILTNIADTPEQCNFYLSSIVQKGNLKIAISTNGKSPTIAKRTKELLNETIPDNINTLLDNMYELRNRLKGDFKYKVDTLNSITQDLIITPPEEKIAGNYWRKVASWSLFGFFFMFAGYAISSFITVSDIYNGAAYVGRELGNDFYLMILTGFVAQMVDGALGMGYGVTSTAVLLGIGVPLPAISSSVHTAEMFASGVSGFSHYKFGNVNKRLFKIILVPGIIGAVAGAYLLSRFGLDYSSYIKPFLAVYTLFLGIKILLNAFKKKQVKKKLRNVGWLAGMGGFLDSFGGGGWGPLVTSTLISKGKAPRYVIGTVSITEFFVTLASALTFFSMIGISHWKVIVGLVLGGALAAPLAAKLVGRLPLKIMFIGIGAMIIFWSINILIRAI